MKLETTSFKQAYQLDKPEIKLIIQATKMHLQVQILLEPIQPQTVNQMAPDQIPLLQILLFQLIQQTDQILQILLTQQ